MMTNMPIGHPFRRPAAWGELRFPLLLAPIAKGRSYFCAKCYNSHSHRSEGLFHLLHDTNCEQSVSLRKRVFRSALDDTLGWGPDRENWLCWYSFPLARRP